MRTYVRMKNHMILALMVPRFDLVTAVSSREKLLSPVALAPLPGAHRIGTASASAATQGVSCGMSISEALVACPTLELIPPDPQGVELLWERYLAALEELGAEVESDIPGRVCFRIDGMMGLYGGTVKRTIHEISRVIPGAKIGLGPSRFAGLVAASEARPTRYLRLPSDHKELVAALTHKSIKFLRFDRSLSSLVGELSHLGIETLGQVRELGLEVLATRFGKAGVRAYELSEGRDSKLNPRHPPERFIERIGINEDATFGQIQAALELLIGRLLARKDRRKRSFRALSLAAKLAKGGTWLERVVLRERVDSQVKLKLVFTLRLEELTEPITDLSLSVVAFGAPLEGVQQNLLALKRDQLENDRKVLDAVRQARTLRGSEAILKAQIVDPQSRLPERRAILTPFE